MPRTAPLPSTRIPESLVAPENPGGRAHNSSPLAAAACSAAANGAGVPAATPLAADTHGTRPLHPRGGAREPDKAGCTAGALRPLPPAVAEPMTQARASPSWGSKAPPPRCPRKQRRQQHQHWLQQSRASPAVQAATAGAEGENAGRGRAGRSAHHGVSSTASDNAGRDTRNSCYSTTYWKTKAKQWKCEPLGLVGLFMTTCSVARRAPLSMELSRQEDWRSAGGLPNTGIKPRSPALQTDSLPSEPPGKPYKQKKDL